MRFAASLVLLATVALGCGGKVVVDDGAGGTPSNATPSSSSTSNVVSSSIASSSSISSSSSSGIVDPNCFAICSDVALHCSDGSDTGELLLQSQTSTGCVWSLAVGGQSTVILTMDCSEDLPCMYEDGQCFILNWAAPGDTLVAPLGFATETGDWDCSVVKP